MTGTAQRSFYRALHSVHRRAVVSVLAMAAVVAPIAAEAQNLTAAHQLLNEWQLEDAKQAAEKLLRDDPKEPKNWFLAARVHHALGNHTTALNLARAAARRGVDVSGLMERIEGSAHYAAWMTTEQTEHFRISYLNKDEVVAHFAKDVLEAAYANIGKALGFYPADHGTKIAVEIYPDARGLAAASGLTLEAIQKTGTIAVAKFHRLMIISPLATANGYSWADTLTHEFTHLVVSKKSRNSIPIWLHEGIAKFYEKTWRETPGAVLSGWAEKLLAEATKSGKFITFAQMHPSMALLPSQRDAALAFAEVATVVEFLTARYGRDSIADVLELAGTGMSLEKALKRRVGAGISGIERVWQKWLRTRNFRLDADATPQRIELATSERSGEEERPLETIDDKDVHRYSRLGELLQLRGHTKAAVVEYQKAYKKSGTQYITLVNRLARAYAEIDRLDEASKVLQAGLRAHPEDSDAHLMAGRIALSREKYADAAKHFGEVRLHNPFNPEIHAAFAKLYEAEGNERELRRAKNFFELTRKPRSESEWALPAPEAGEARLSLVTPTFSQVRVDGRAPVPSPAFDLGVAPGEHEIEYRKLDGKIATKKIKIKAGASRAIALE